MVIEFDSTRPPSTPLHGPVGNFPEGNPNRPFASGISARISGERLRLSSGYEDGCDLHEPETSFDGDCWLEGLRTSIANGIYEVWVDDILGGPMVKRDRLKVYEANARYTKDIDPTEQRFSGKRVHPGADTLPSTAITPIRQYIYDFLGDPHTYAGILAVVLAILRGLGDDSETIEYDTEYVDLGELDYGAIYNKHEGVEI
jgi:hypothetical protein